MLPITLVYKESVMRTVVKILILLSTVMSAAVSAEFDHTYPDYKNLLKKYLKSDGPQTLFHYEALNKSPKELERVLLKFRSLKKKEYEGFSREEKLAFLINTYNLFTIKLIIDNYPLKSIKDIGSIFSGPWSKEIVSLFEEKFTLDNIEHDMIRKDFKEPRIHFAVNCASIGCPSLNKEPFLPKSLNDQLDFAAKNFLQNKKKNFYDSKKNTLKLSKIFKWYGDDWKKMKGSPYLSFVENFIPEIKGKKPDIDFLDYDWSLNEFRKE
jgi:hypothetical protein